jgi:hypothetical protein
MRVLLGILKLLGYIVYLLFVGFMVSNFKFWGFIGALFLMPMFIDISVEDYRK